MKKPKHLSQRGHIHLLIPLICVLIVGFIGARIVLSHSSAQSNCTVSPILVNSCHPLLGAYVVDYPGLSSLTGLPQVQGEEQRTGVNLDVVHTTYHSPGEDSLNSEEVSIANSSNQTVYLNWKPASKWADASGGNSSVNADIKHMADSVKQVKHKIFITVWHEPGNDVVSSASTSTCKGKGSAGTPAQYVAMWKNVESIFHQEGANNVVWSILFQEYPPVACWDQALYPGNSYINWVGYDTYGNGGTSDSFQKSAGAGYQYLEKLSGEANTSTYGMLGNSTMKAKPVVLGELGSCRASYSSQVNADYWNDAKTSLDQHLYPDIQLYMIFDAPGSGYKNPKGNHYPGGCQVGYTQSGSATDLTQQKAYNAFANDPIFQSTTTTTPPPPSKQPAINSFKASPSSVKVGANSKLSWSDTNVKNCTLTPGGPKHTTAKSWTTPLYSTSDVGSHTYRVNCQGSSGTTVESTVNVVVSSANTVGFLCETSSTNCASLPAGGSPSEAEAVSVIPKSKAWKWDEASIGKVSSSWPFTNSSLSSTYKGDKVVQFILDDNHSYCLANNGAPVIIRLCDTQAPQLWVINGKAFVNPSASDNNAAKFVLTNVSNKLNDVLQSSSKATIQEWSFGS